VIDQPVERAAEIERERGVVRLAEQGVLEGGAFHMDAADGRVRHAHAPFGF